MAWLTRSSSLYLCYSPPCCLGLQRYRCKTRPYSGWLDQHCRIKAKGGVMRPTSVPLLNNTKEPMKLRPLLPIHIYSGISLTSGLVACGYGRREGSWRTACQSDCEQHLAYPHLHHVYGALLPFRLRCVPFQHHYFAKVLGQHLCCSKSSHTTAHNNSLILLSDGMLLMATRS